MRKNITRSISLLLALCFIISALASCSILELINAPVNKKTEATLITIKGEDSITMTVGETIALEVEADGELYEEITWEASNSAVYVSASGRVSANTEGTVTVYAKYKELSASVLIKIVADDADILPPDDDSTSGGEKDDDTAGDNNGNEDNSDGDNPTTGGGNDNEGDDPDADNGDGGDDSDGDKNNGEDEKDEVIIPPDKYVNMSREEFYADYTPAVNLEDALLRSEMGFMSGDITLPELEPEHAAYQPMKNGMYVRSTDSVYRDNGNTYIIYDAYGREVSRIYRGGGYITLEEVAAYLYAFGEIPANYDSNKSNKTISKSPKSEWGIYLRLNDSQFSGDTSRYPYEPELPDISGCGGSLIYNEVDIGTTAGYNNGTKISRNVARIVYVKSRSGAAITNPEERYVFYTYNHYNDFTEYLNYFGGWGQIFGNITGGGEYNDKSNPKPTPYPEVYREGIVGDEIVAAIIIPYILPEREYI